MSKNLKKILVASASLLMMASVGVGVSQSVQTAHADMPGISRTLRRFDHTKGALEDQYNSPFNKALGGMLEVSVYAKHPVNFYRRGHVFTVIPNESTPGKVIRVDGHRVYSKRQVLSRLHGHHHYRKHTKRHARRHARKHSRRSHRRYRK